MAAGLASRRALSGSPRGALRLGDVDFDSRGPRRGAPRGCRLCLAASSQRPPPRNAEALGFGITIIAGPDAVPRVAAGFASQRALSGSLRGTLRLCGLDFDSRGPRRGAPRGCDLSPAACHPASCRPQQCEGRLQRAADHIVYREAAKIEKTMTPQLSMKELKPRDVKAVSSELQTTAMSRASPASCRPHRLPGGREDKEDRGPADLDEGAEAGRCEGCHPASCRSQRCEGRLQRAADHIAYQEAAKTEKAAVPQLSMKELKPRYVKGVSGELQTTAMRRASPASCRPHHLPGGRENREVADPQLLRKGLGPKDVKGLSRELQSTPPTGRPRRSRSSLSSSSR